MTYSQLEKMGTGEYPVKENSFGIDRVNYDSRTGRIAVRVGESWKSCGSVEIDERFDDDDHFIFYLNGEKICGGVLEPIGL
jgi:hypothetical protein